MKTVEQQEAICQEKFKTLFNSINKMDAVIEKIQNLTISLNNLAGDIKTIIEKQIETENKILKIEKKEIDRYEMIKNCIITGIATAILTIILDRLNLNLKLK